MTNYERMLAGEPFIVDGTLAKHMSNARRLQELYNATPSSETQARQALLTELLGSIGENSSIQAPFHCDYGFRIHIGSHTFINYGCTFLDQGGITIGDHVLLGPNVGLYAAGHPIDPAVRRTDLEFGQPIVIEDNVWLGGGVIVNPGVTIGKNTVIGSGSVVVRDIPPNVVAAGNPCKPIRPITETDRAYWEQLQTDFAADADT